MGGVRARKSRRNKSLKQTTGQKRKKRKNPTIGSHILRSHWDASKTVRQNLKSMGVAFDPNDPVKAGVLKRKKNENSSTEMEVEVQSTEVLQKLEIEASNDVKKERHVAPGEASFILSLSRDYGTNYQAMAKDKRNYMQHSANQLRRKFEGFFKSSYYKKYTEEEKGDGSL